MAKNRIDILIRTLYERTGIKASVKDLSRMNYSVNKTGQVVDSFSGKLADSTKVMKDMGKNAMPRFQMGWLSVMFAAMKVKMIMTRIWKDMIATFKKVGGKMHPLNLAMTRLQAGFTYLKYSILEAMGPMLQKFVIWLANMAIAIGDMDPNTLKNIGIALVAITGVAFVGGFIAEFALLANGLVMLAKDAKVMAMLGTGGWLAAGLAAIGVGFAFNPEEATNAITKFVDAVKGKDLFKAIEADIEFSLAIIDGWGLFGEWLGKNAVKTMKTIGTVFYDVMIQAGKDIIETWKTTTFSGFISWLVEKLVSGFKMIPSLVLGLPALPSKVVGGGVATGMIDEVKSWFTTGKEAEEDNPWANAMSETNNKLASLASATTLAVDETLIPKWGVWGEEIDLEKVKIDNVKSAIDAIPNHTTKIIEIKTIRTEG